MRFLTLKRQRNKFDGWISQYYSVLFKHALWMTGSRDIASDMVQDAFYQAWCGISSLRDEDRILPWLLTILRRAVYKEQRHQYRHLETISELAALESENVHSADPSFLDIYSAFENLSPANRETILLHYLHGFSYAEISEQLEIPIGTVMSRIARGKAALQKLDELNSENVVRFDDIRRGGG